ncbi:MAG: winged helix-turn-helix domain-containing protein [Candidatus Heteroscillospira sp.]|jgi:DNA-binding response OmpR family regulator
MKILIVEDDADIAMLEQDYLRMSDMESEIISDGCAAEQAILRGGWDLVLLDVMLPGKSGYDVCRTVRELVDVPILMVTARDESADKIRGLGLGADDYIAKPFDPAELVARVRSHLARYTRLKSAPPEKKRVSMVRAAGLEIYADQWLVRKNGREIRLPNREFELLLFLAEHPSTVFSKEQLFERLWGFDYMGDSATVTVHINRIREKIEDDPKKPRIIETVWGAGYKLNP